MTRATTEGRRLRLELEGIDEPFFVDPLPAKRGKYLTDEFIASALVQRSIPQATQIFIEAFGPSNYSRMSGLYVDEFDVETGKYLRTWDPDGERQKPMGVGDVIDLEPGDGIKFLERERLEGEPDIDGEPIRQEEAEAICLCAFYWQTVVGMEAVQAFIEGGEGTAGSLKAMGLLQTRTMLSTSPSSRQAGMESVILQQAGSVGTTATARSSGSVRVPADHKRPLRVGSKKPRRS